MAGVTGVAGTTVASLLGVPSLFTGTVAVASLDVLALVAPVLTSAVATGLMALGVLQLVMITMRLNNNMRFIFIPFISLSGGEGGGDGFFGMDAGGVKYGNKRVTLIDQQGDFGTPQNNPLGALGDEISDDFAVAQA